MAGLTAFHTGNLSHHMIIFGYDDTCIHMSKGIYCSIGHLPSRFTGGYQDGAASFRVKGF